MIHDILWLNNIDQFLIFYSKIQILVVGMDVWLYPYMYLIQHGIITKTFQTRYPIIMLKEMLFIELINLSSILVFTQYPFGMF